MNYYTTSGAFDDLCAFKNILTIINDYDVKDREYKDEIKNLNERIRQLENKQCITGARKTIDEPIDLNYNCVIKQEYILYIMRYGVPEDGIFLPSLLEELAAECNCDCDTDDTQLVNSSKDLLLPDTDVYIIGGKISDYNQVLNLNNITEINP